MPIHFTCTGCGKSYTVPDSASGGTTQCRQCGIDISIPKSATPPAPVTPVPNKPAPITPVPAPLPVAVLPNKPAKPFPIQTIALIGAVVMLVGCVVPGLGYGIWMLLFATGNDDPMKFMPDNCQSIIAVQTEQVLNSPAYAELKKAIPDLVTLPFESVSQNLGIPTTDIQKMTLLAGDLKKPEGIIVFKTKRPVTSAELLAHIKAETPYTESKIGTYVILEGTTNSFCVVEPRIVLVGTTALLKAVLERNAKPAIPEPLQQCLQETNLARSGALVLRLSAESKQEVTAIFTKYGINANALASIQGIAATAVIDKDLQLTVTLLCKDEKTADDNRKIAEGLCVMGKNSGVAKEVGEMFDSVKVVARGSRVIISVQIPTSTIKAMGKTAP